MAATAVRTLSSTHTAAAAAAATATATATTAARIPLAGGSIACPLSSAVFKGASAGGATCGSLSLRAGCRQIHSSRLSSSARSAFTRQTYRIRPRALPLQVQTRRGYADGSGGGSGGGAGGSSGGSGSGLYWALGLAGVAGAGYYAHANGYISTTPMAGAVEKGKEKASAAGQKVKKEIGSGGGSGSGGSKVKGEGDYQAVYNHIAKLLEERDEYEDGSYGPLLVRLAWHCSGTYDKETGTGGSNGATMRFAPEGDHGANAGLKLAREFLDPVKEHFPWISYSDLWTLAGVAAIQEMQGPIIPWRPGRSDRDVSFCTPDGRLPDGSKEQSHLRAIFGRMGFNDAEIVALSGAHALGRCHTDRSGFDGPWTFSPTVLTNEYFRLLLDEKWNVRKWAGPKQFQDQNTKSLMMLPTDMALVRDKEFRKHVERFAQDEGTFFKEFSDVIMRLFELGVPFATAGVGSESESSRMRLKPLNGRGDDE